MKKPSFHRPTRTTFTTILRGVFWFSLGAVLGIFFFTSFVFILYQNLYGHSVYPGITVAGLDFGGKSRQQVAAYFAQKNAAIANTKFLFTDGTHSATISARQLTYGYDQNLLAQQAYSIGRSGNVISDLSIVFQAYIHGIDLPAAYHYNADKVTAALTPLAQQINTSPTDALFTFENNHVTAFRLSKNGQKLDVPATEQTLAAKTSTVLTNPSVTPVTIPLVITAISPHVSDDKAKTMGITELIASGTSLYQGSIDSRVYNITLAATRLNGTLIAPGEVFSFDKAVGDISSLNGYKQAYVIQNGHTVLGDGGGVCQVSTTMFRAALYAGLPIVERHPHAYRVHYYEEDTGLPGIDAAIYSPTVDLKFKNDTGHYILIQTVIDPNEQRLTFNFYGTKDDREVTIGTPVITSQTPAPDPLYQDDPTLPTGTVKQIDFAAAGATVYFTRTVKKDGKVVISDKFSSNYRPWQAVYLRGTKS